MGEIGAKIIIINLVAITGLIFGFISNLSNIISVFIGVGSLVFLVFRGLNERENWLTKKVKRKQEQLKLMKEEEQYIRDAKIKV